MTHFLNLVNFSFQWRTKQQQSRVRSHHSLISGGTCTDYPDRCCRHKNAKSQACTSPTSSWDSNGTHTKSSSSGTTNVTCDPTDQPKCPTASEDRPKCPTASDSKDQPKSPTTEVGYPPQTRCGLHGWVRWQRWSRKPYLQRNWGSKPTKSDLSLVICAMIKLYCQRPTRTPRSCRQSYVPCLFLLFASLLFCSLLPDYMPLMIFLLCFACLLTACFLPLFLLNCPP